MEERKESHQLNIMPIGAGREVGRSCVIMECAGRQIMFDCGIHMNRQHRGKNALPYFEKIKPEELDLILITHFHLDHCGALPYFLKNYKFKGQIYMTRPTKEIYNLVLRDSIKVKSENLDQDLMTEASINSSLERIKLIDYNQEINHNGIRVKCYNAGHVLGAAMFMVEIEGIRVLYTGDYSTENERHLRPAQIPNEKIHVLISESTYGDTLHEPRAKREENLLQEIVKTLKGGGNVLLPVFATGRCHELLIILDEYWQKHPEIQQFPIFSTCTLATKCINIFQKYINKLGERFQKENLFNFKFVQTKKNIDEVQQSGMPKVVMASPGLLQSGHSKQLFELWCQDSRNQVIVTGQAVQETIAWKLVNNQLPKYLIKNQECDVRVRAHTISFSAHADYNQTSAFINGLKPSHIVLVHGTSSKCSDLQIKIRANFKGIVQEVWTPENQSKVPLLFEKSNINQTGCKAIGKMADEIEQFKIKFSEEHAQHVNTFEKSEMQEEQCQCCTNEISFNGILLNTEHGFLLCDETDQEMLDKFGISQDIITNSMYVPFVGSLDQIYQLVKKVCPEYKVDLNQDDEKILVSDLQQHKIRPHLEIQVPMTYSQQSQFLQFKWTSYPEADQIAESLAYFMSNITPNELKEIERGNQKQLGLINALQQAGFQATTVDEDDVLIKFKDKEIAKADLSQLKVYESTEDILRQRLEQIYNAQK